MRNYQSQLVIQYNSRVKEREKRDSKKINISAEKSAKETKSAQYNV